MHVGIYPLLTSLFVNIYLFHVLKFFDYRIPRLPFEIVACTLPFLQNETNRPIGEHSVITDHDYLRHQHKKITFLFVRRNFNIFPIETELINFSTLTLESQM